MNVKLIAHTKLSEEFYHSLNSEIQYAVWSEVSDGQAVALTAIRTCYSHLQPSEILNGEFRKYFGSKATDGKEGTEADRLIRHIMNSGHTSTMEHITFTFAIEGVSRSLLAQLTRHRHFSYSVQSQRYVKLESGSKSGGMGYVVPESIKKKGLEKPYRYEIEKIQGLYDTLRELGVPAEDARYILPNAATCNLVLTGNLRSILEFYSKRNPNTHAQWEIKDLAERMKEEVIKVEAWLEPFFK